MNDKNCNNCVWNNNCYIQNAIKNYMRHKHSKIKIDLSDFHCSNYESAEMVKQQSSEIDKIQDLNETDYLNFYSSE
jgi:hypothetical protein